MSGELSPLLVRSHFSEGTTEAAQALKDAHELAGFIADHFTAVLDTVGADTSGVGLVVQSTIGASLSATDWWINSQSDPSAAMPCTAFFEHLSAIVWGIIESSVRARGIRIDPTATLRIENIEVVEAGTIS
ncbi:hypothetical protein [Nocardia sp. 852002-51101_SCH5132738]|uniref:hypothetical protein n=1 Tax=Nocardia sp. 852002-51101_SCH5132738 TaxID=1834095 RepID=UPI000A6FB0E4|nr:hypothetical protein [Nocardia sp. 852002-51101_SCH5132738]